MKERIFYFDTYILVSFTMNGTPESFRSALLHADSLGVISEYWVVHSGGRSIISHHYMLGQRLS